MGFLGAKTFGFLPNSSGSGPGSTPTWQQVTDVGNTTTDDIFVQDTATPTPNNYLSVDKTNNAYFLGDGANLIGMSIAATTQRYDFGEIGSGFVISMLGATPTTRFGGTAIFTFPDGIASYSSGNYSALVLNTTASPNAWQIQPKDMLPEQSITADYLATVADCILLVVTSVADINITLPTTVLAGKRFFIKLNGGAHNVIIAASSGTIDGAASQTISVLYQSLEVYFDGTNYWII